MRGCLRGIGNLVTGLVGLALIAVAALYLYIFPRIDSVLEDSVRRQFMLGPEGTVIITRGSLLDTFEGQVEQMYVEAAGARIEGMDVEDVRFVADGVYFDLPQTLLTKQAQWKSIVNARLTLKVSEAAILSRWKTELESKGLKDVTVKFTDGKANITGLAKLGPLKMRVGAAGKLLANGSDKVAFHATNVDLGGAKFGIGDMNAIFSTLTPVLDLGSLRLGVGVDKLDTRDGYLLVEASSRRLDQLSRRMERSETPQADAGETTPPSAGSAPVEPAVPSPEPEAGAGE